MLCNLSDLGFSGDREHMEGRTVWNRRLWQAAQLCSREDLAEMKGNPGKIRREHSSVLTNQQLGTGLVRPQPTIGLRRSASCGTLLARPQPPAHDWVSLLLFYCSSCPDLPKIRKTAIIVATCAGHSWVRRTRLDGDEGLWCHTFLPRRLRVSESCA